VRTFDSVVDGKAIPTALVPIEFLLSHQNEREENFVADVADVADCGEMVRGAEGAEPRRRFVS
jgi:hypothetical protein